MLCCHRCAARLLISVVPRFEISGATVCTRAVTAVCRHVFTDCFQEHIDKVKEFVTRAAPRCLWLPKFAMHAIRLGNSKQYKNGSI